MMKLSEQLRAERAFVERTLGESEICKRCGATLATYAKDCTADLADMCSGFVATETAKNQWKGFEAK